MTRSPRSCGDCGAMPGEVHQDGCDVARCLTAGIQRLQCCEDHDCGTETWSGAWPGEADCEVLGWHSYFIPYKGWLRCGPGHPEAGPDLNRLAMETEWDPQACRHRRPGDPVDDTAYVHWHLQHGFALEPSASYTIDGVTLPCGELLERIGRAA